MAKLMPKSAFAPVPKKKGSDNSAEEDAERKSKGRKFASFEKKEDK